MQNLNEVVRRIYDEEVVKRQTGEIGNANRCSKVRRRSTERYEPFTVAS